MEIKPALGSIRLAKEIGVLKTLQKVTSKLDLADVILVLGSAAVFYGVYYFDSRVAWILLGAGLIYLSIRMERGK